MSAKVERQLDHLPEYGAPLSAWRDWLTEALSPADGFRLHDFLRHGRQRGDACELVVIVPDGKHRSFEIEEQRWLSSSTSLRATIIGATDGLLRPRPLTKGELEDIWTALVTLATVKVTQSKADEARDWLEQTIEGADELTGHSLAADAREAALEALLARNRFDYLAARRFTDPNAIDPPRPALLLDDQTGERWMRVGELATFWRHVLGVGVMSQPSIDGRLAAIGVKRHEYQHKLGGVPRHVRLYRVSAAEDKAK